MATELTQKMEASANRKVDWWRLGDGAVLALYSGIVLWTLQYHEKWADEAQAWLIARDLDLKTIWFHELRYEGSPGLWHTILWIAQHVFHLGYGALGYIGVLFAIAGAAVLIFVAPFPRYIRWPLAFTYVIVYQYAVIARPYTLLPLLCFTAAYFFPDVQRPGRITVVLSLLALLTLHGLLIAACLGLAYLLDAREQWDELSNRVKRGYYVSVVGLSCVFAFVVAILRPTPDVEEFALKGQLAASPVPIHLPSFQQKLTAVITGSFMDWIVPSVLFLLIAGAWCIVRRKWASFLLPVSGLIVFYCMVHGYAHHHGTVFVSAVTGLWIAWPSQAELNSFNGRKWVEFRTVQVGILCLCAVNMVDAYGVIRNEYLYPYNGGKDAAEYLRSVGADRTTMFGLLYGIVGVQAYFDRNIFSNCPTTYFHHGVPLHATTLNPDDLMRYQPEYIVSYSNDPEIFLRYGAGQLNSFGYEQVHFSDGYYLYKRGVYQREVYFIFKRKLSEPISQ